MTTALAGPEAPAESPPRPVNDSGALLGVTPQAPFVRFPPRPVAVHWPATEYDRSEVLDLVGSTLCSLPGSRAWTELHRGLHVLFDWLGAQSGENWQERWLASGADAAGVNWARGPAAWLEREGRYSPYLLERMARALLALVSADIVRPSIAWLLTGAKNRNIARDMMRSRDPQGFAQLHSLCQQDPGVTPTAESHSVFRVAVILAAKGGMLAEITIGDVLEILEVEADFRRYVRSGSVTFKMLREMGVFGPGVPTLEEIRSAPQRSVEELIDYYPISSRAMRDLLVDYLKERQPSVDYNTLYKGAYVLAGCFWVDLERHHPGIDTLRLSPDVAGAWKLRLRTKTTTERTAAGETVEVAVERLSYLDTLSAVRAFYLDLSQWALDDPGRWAQWVAPCPISSEELTRRKAVRRRKARMDARTRERLPVLPVLVRTVDQWRKDSAAVLAAARETQPGEVFTCAGQTLVRVRLPHGAANNVWAKDPVSGERRFLNREEDHAFWAWAIIEVLRLSGVRVEELTELSHYSLVQYRLPSTEELVPLLQIAPSKTDTERLLVVSPELADVLSMVISRIRDETGSVPLVRARDHHERLWMAPAPLLFQRFRGAENHAFSVGAVGDLLDEALSHTGLLDQGDGTPLRYTPHDFRRIMITDAIRNGLPPHIAQVIAGHRDINVTMGYNAVYPDEAIQAHLAFLARRRALRPSDEYHVPTDQEWQEFLGHFERRKVSIGTCARAFATPCIHEHACVRCSMLWPDEAQRGRLVEIRDNLAARITEAHREGWLGEVEGLEFSLAGAENKLAQIDSRHSVPAVAVELRATPSRDVT